nr:porin [Gemmobacter straminiformis]
MVGTAGFAAAEVTISGSARMGITNAYDTTNDANKTQFSSRARVNFAASGETDGGLSFGASFRADNAGDANSGTAGTVSLSGAFGSISMGDNDSAALTTVGQVDGVGFTGNGDLNEIIFLGEADTSALYTYTMGDLTIAASMGQIDGDTNYTGNAKQAASVAASYKMGNYRFSAAIERGDKAVYSFSDRADAYATDPEDTYAERNDLTSQVTLGADATFGALVLKGRVAMGSGEAYNGLPDEPNGYKTTGTQVAVSATYTMDALSVTAFGAHAKVAYDYYGTDWGMESTRYGVGASYDLGGGAKAQAGLSRLSHDALNDDGDWSDTKMDAGLTFAF